MYVGLEGLGLGGTQGHREGIVSFCVGVGGREATNSDAGARVGRKRPGKNITRN